jgi:hypothetical protein
MDSPELIYCNYEMLQYPNYDFRIYTDGSLNIAESSASGYKSWVPDGYYRS